jgi:hypothetical protein
MTSRTRQASPEALDHFGSRANRSGDRLEGILSTSRAKVLAPSGKLDNFGVLDELTAAYPAAANDALRAVQQLTEVVDDLARAARRSGDRFRQADKPAQGPG